MDGDGFDGYTGSIECVVFVEFEAFEQGEVCVEHLAAACGVGGVCMDYFYEAAGEA